MENTPEELNKPINEEQAPTEQPTIFSDISTDMSGYQKNIKGARVWLYIIGVMQIGIGFYEYAQTTGYAENFRWIAFGVDAFIGLVFLGLAILSYKKPAISFIVALIFYIIVNVLVIYTAGISSVSFFWVIKILIVIALIRAIKDAREYAALKKGLDLENE